MFIVGSAPAGIPGVEIDLPRRAARRARIAGPLVCAMQHRTSSPMMRRNIIGKIRCTPLTPP
jgi:hypothetical protein